MRTFTSLLIAAMAALSGCDYWTSDEACDAWLVQSFRDDAINNALVAEHTIYPYHFVPNTAALTELGQHDLCVLAEHFKRFAGPLNVRRGQATEELYEARLTAVTSFLAEAGVEAEKVKISDGLPGGDGMISDEVLSAFQEKRRSYWASVSGYAARTNAAPSGGYLPAPSSESPSGE